VPGLIKREDVDTVRERARIEEIVSAHVTLKPAGVGSLQGLCPFHDERTPSFSISTADKVFYCFGCGEGGDVFDFVMKSDGFDFVGALEYLADRYGVTLQVQEEDPKSAERRRHRERLLQLLERAAQYYERYLWESSEAEAARDYLAGRGLNEDVLRTFRVGYAPSSWDKLLLGSRRAGFSAEELHDAGLTVKSQKGVDRYYDRFRRRIMFPLWDARGRVIGFGARAMGEKAGAKYVNTPETVLFHKGHVLYGQHLARAAAAKASTTVVVEGYTDVLALHQANIHNAVCIMGTSLTDEQLGGLLRMAPRCVLALDADDAGQEAMLRGARVAEGRKLELRVASLPQGKDPAELLAEQGAEAVQELLGGSVPFVRFRVERILATAGSGDAESRDAALSQLRPILSAMAPSVLREELAATAAKSLALSAALAALLVRAPGARDAGEPHSSGPGPRAVAPVHQSPTAVGVGVGVRSSKVERSFLTMCLAHPGAGTELLATPDLAERFQDPLLRRAAEHLAVNLADPVATVDDSDDELAALLRQMAVRAAGARATEQTLRADWFQLELQRISREIGGAGQSGADVIALAQERERIREQYERLTSDS
jgi:DNA primase